MYSVQCTVHKASVQQLAQVGPNGAHHSGLRTEDARERRGAGQFVDTVHSVYSIQLYSLKCIKCIVFTLYTVYTVQCIHRVQCIVCKVFTETIILELLFLLNG